MRQAKRDTLWKEIETEGKWRKNETNRFYTKKRLQKGKTRRYTKGKRGNKRKRTKRN